MSSSGLAATNEPVSASASTDEAPEEEEELFKFSCSTPIRCYVSTGLDVDENESFTLSHCGDVRKNENDAEILVEHIDMKKRPASEEDGGQVVPPGEPMFQHLQRPPVARTQATGVSDSLAEFEETERKLASSPLAQMEGLLADLRSNFNAVEVEAEVTLDEEAAERTPRADRDQELKRHELELEAQAVKAGVHNHHPASSSSSTGFFRKNDHIVAVESRLQNEVLRRQHCEKQILELNQQVLELQEQLAVAEGLERKREQFAQGMEASVKKVLRSWREKEAALEAQLEQAKQENAKMRSDETKLNMRIDHLKLELKEKNEEIVSEKVKAQSASLETARLRDENVQAQRALSESRSQQEASKKEIDSLKEYNKSLEGEMKALNAQIDDLTKEKKELETKAGQLTSTNDQLIAQNEKLRDEYETLINETKMVVTESERQYVQLMKSIDTEKIAKDSLQVELNLAEEKFQNTVKSVVDECERKMQRAQTAASEREKALQEAHRAEIEALNARLKCELDKMREKHFDDLQAKIKDYEMKITDLGLKIDSQRAEIERMHRVNADLENDRNTLRLNVKKMLEVQMKETMQLLGVSTPSTAAVESLTKQETSSLQSASAQSFRKALDAATATDRSAKRLESANSTLFGHEMTALSHGDFLAKYHHSGELSARGSDPVGIKTSSPNPALQNLQSGLSSSRFDSSSAMSMIARPLEDEHRSAKPAASSSIADLLLTSFSTATTTTTTLAANKPPSSKSSSLNASTVTSQPVNVPSSAPHEAGSQAIKDSFILSQIDLINQYYQIDNKALAVAAATAQTATASAVSVATPLGNNRFSVGSSSSANTDKSLTSSSTNSSSSSIGGGGGAKRPSQTDAFDLDAQKSSLRSRSLSSSTQALVVENLKSKTAEQQQQPAALGSNAPANRSNELRHFIELLLNRSPSKEVEAESNSKPSQAAFTTNSLGSFQPINPAGNQSTPPVQTPAVAKAAFVTTHVDVKELKPAAKPVEPATKARRYDSSLSSSDDDSEDEEDEVNYIYSKHNLSDIDLGYTKRESLDYYDDVKRTLKFDEDDEEQPRPRPRPEEAAKNTGEPTKTSSAFATVAARKTAPVAETKKTAQSDGSKTHQFQKATTTTTAQQSQTNSAPQRRTAQAKGHHVSIAAEPTGFSNRTHSMLSLHSHVFSSANTTGLSGISLNSSRDHRDSSSGPRPTRPVKVAAPAKWK